MTGLLGGAFTYNATSKREVISCHRPGRTRP
jgi:hypothetical protein